MSLLHVKTHDLSQQDHILNFESMLNPIRSSLLLNKHRGLEARRDTQKHMCEVERKFALNNFMVEKRIVERKAQLLQKMIDRRICYSAPRHSSPSSISEDSVSLSSKTGSKSAKERGHMAHRGSHGKVAPVTNLKNTENSHGVRNMCGNKKQFSVNSSKARPQSKESVFELSASAIHTSDESDDDDDDDDDNVCWKSTSSNVTTTQKTHAIGSIITERSSDKAEATKNMARVKSPTQQSKRDTCYTAPTIRTSESNRLSAATAKSVHFAEITEKWRSTEKIKIDERVQKFISKTQKFKDRPVSRSSSDTWLDFILHSPCDLGCSTSRGAPGATSRPDKFADGNMILRKAFDDFCLCRNKSELHKLVKLASKLKSQIGVERSRPVSVMPVIASLKSKRALQASIVRPTTAP